MIAGGHPRGLPGAVALEVALQQRITGHPLDDIVIRGRNRDGSAATLEVQVKRALNFTTSDREFADVAGQLLIASKKPAFRGETYELAIAIAKSTTSIDRHVQETLRWARRHTNADAFFTNLDREGFASKGMRNFVNALTTHLVTAGGNGDGDEVWQILRRLNVLVFDFEHPGSDYEHRAHDLAASVLHQDSRERAIDLWNALIVDVEETMSAAGSRDRQTVVEKMAGQGGFLFEPTSSLKNFFENLADHASLAAADLTDDIGGARLSRTELLVSVLEGMEQAKVVNITGKGGVGKSAVLLHVLEIIRAEATPIVVSDTRIIPGGWPSMAHVLGTSLPSRVVFDAISAAGGAVVFIDNIDQIESPTAGATLRDLLRAVANYPGWRAVVTSNSASSEWRNQLPDGLVHQMVSVEVAEISDADAADLAQQNTGLAAILDAEHPAKKIARNLFFLRRIADFGNASAGVSTELDLARLWWRLGGGRRNDQGRLGRLRVLRELSGYIWSDPNLTAVRTDLLDPGILTELLHLDTLREVRVGADVTFSHDVLRDWAVGFYLLEHPEVFRDSDKRHPLATSLARAVEITARLIIAEDPTGAKWTELLHMTDGEDVHSSWRRPILLAAVRGETPEIDLRTLSDALLQDDAAVLREFLRQFHVSDTVPAVEWFRRMKPDALPPALVSDLAVPSGRTWLPVISWLSRVAPVAPRRAVPEMAAVFFSWLMATSQLPLEVNRSIVQLCFEWLALIDEDVRPRHFRATETVPPSSGIPNLKDTGDALRTLCFMFAQVNKDAARTYLESVNRREVQYGELDRILKNRGNLARAAPAEFATFLLRELTPDRDEQDRHRYGPFMMHDGKFMPESPSQGPFLEILEADAPAGLRLVRGVVNVAMEWLGGGNAPAFDIPFPDGMRRFPGGLGVYLMGRSGQPSALVACALMALEAWAHRQIEAGRPAAEVLADVWGPDLSSAAFLAVSVDVILSHWNACRDLAWPLFTATRLLQADTERAVRDQAGAFSLGKFGVEPSGPVKLDDLNARPSRGAQLVQFVEDYAFEAPAHVRESLLPALDRAVADALSSASADDDPLRGVIAVARRTRRMADAENWLEDQHTTPDGRTIRAFIPEDGERLLFAASYREAVELCQRTERIAWLHLAFDRSVAVTAEQVNASVAWAKHELENPHASEVGTEKEMASRAVVTAAMLVARDYQGDDRATLLDWALPLLRERAALPAKAEGYENDQMRYDEAALATIGLLAVAGPDRPLAERAASLLPLAVAARSAASNAIGSVLKSWPDDDPLVRAILRILMVKATYPWTRYGDSERSKKKQEHADWVQRVADAELRWLLNEADEPAWPDLPPWINRPRRRRVITRSGIEQIPQRSRAEPEAMVDQQRLAKVVSHVFPLMIGRTPVWVPPLMNHLLAWTIAANSGEDDDTPDGRPYEWNAEFYQDLGFLVAASDQDAGIKAFVLPLLKLGDDAFHEAAGSLLRGFDIAVFSTDALKPMDQVTLRRTIADRIRLTWNYERIGREKGMNSETNAGGALTALFFAPPGFMPDRRVRITKDWSGLEDAMPILTGLVTGAPCSGYLATLLLDVLAAAPRPTLVPAAIACGQAWAQAYGPDAGFWIHNDMGARLCAWLADRLENGAVTLSAPDRLALTTTVDVMIQAGVTSARRLEDILSGRTKAGVS